ncbi:hypothetical protein MTO96_002818 [Rhipicephalus appendiculatus]
MSHSRWENNQTDAMDCCSPATRNKARAKGLAYAVVMLAVLTVDMGIMYASAMVCDAKRRPYIWLSRGFSCFLSAAHVGFIVTWTVAAAADNVQLMTVGITGVAVRLLGKIVYSTIDFIVSLITKPKISHVVALLTLHIEELPAMPFSPGYPTVILLSIELCFLAGLNNYSEIFKKSTEGNNDDSANAAGNRDNSNN